LWSTGSGNTFVGSNAGTGSEGNSTSSWNSFFGSWAGYSNTTGEGNNFIGISAGYNNTTGYHNSFIGSNAGLGNVDGASNNFFGYAAGYANNGWHNSFFGHMAGYSNTTGQYNSFVGSMAGLSNTTEHNNSFFGVNSNGASGITNATALGFRAQVSQSNSLVLGSINGINGADADVNVGIGTAAPQHRLHVVANTGYAALFEGDVHIAGRFSFDSDARLKKQVRGLDYGLREVMQLRPVSWRWKNRTDERPGFGLIAQEVEPILPQLVEQSRNANKTLTVDYVSLVPVLVKAIQEQQDALKQKDAEISTLKAQNARLDARLTALEQTMERLSAPQIAKLKK